MEEVENLLISICIPTYNRSEKVFALVKSLLKYQGANIEVLVVDNCSTDLTAHLLQNIDDKRFRYIKNEKSVVGPVNILKTLVQAKGKYALLCLDKDHLDYKELPAFIARLTAHGDVAFGQCSLNLKAEMPDKVYQKGFDSLMNMAYLSTHPSGTFYDTIHLKSLKMIKEIIDAGKKFAFYSDVVNGEMAMNGKSVVINLPFFYTESIEDCANVPSFTYNSSDIFFALAQRIQEFNIYIDSIVNLPLTKSEMFNLIARIYYRGLISSTISYRAILSDEKVCQHYRVAPKSVTMKELISNASSFALNFMQKQLPISYLDKLKISILGRLRIIYLIFKA